MKASIVITCYNLGQFLEEALNSAIASDHADLEIIVVDDGSTDESTQAHFERLRKQHQANDSIQFVQQENAGVSAARNNGIKLSTGDVILSLDADNKIRPNYISRAVEIFERDAKAGVVFAWAERFGNQSGVWEFPPFDAQKMLLGNDIDNCSVFRKKVWEEVGGFDENRFSEGYEDWDFWLGVMEKDWTFERIAEVMFDYRVRTGSMVSRCNIPEIRQKLVGYLIEKHKSLYVNQWPELLASRELSMLEYQKMIEGYHQRFIESLMEFQNFAREWNERCERLESEVERHRETLHRLRFYAAFQRMIDRSFIGKLSARLRGK